MVKWCFGNVLWEFGVGDWCMLATMRFVGLVFVALGAGVNDISNRTGGSVGGDVRDAVCIRDVRVVFHIGDDVVFCIGDDVRKGDGDVIFRVGDVRGVGEMIRSS
jgi:hypothetical protein